MAQKQEVGAFSSSVSAQRYDLQLLALHHIDVVTIRFERPGLLNSSHRVRSRKTRCVSNDYVAIFLC